MTYYKDGEGCDYFGEYDPSRVIAVGWLAHKETYPQGEVSQEFFRTLVELFVDPWQPLVAMGYHACELCEAPHGRSNFEYEGHKISMGCRNLFLPGEGALIVAPSLILHYIAENQYAPPLFFQETVLRRSQMSQEEFFEAIEAVAPEELLRG